MTTSIITNFPTYPNYRTVTQLQHDHPSNYCTVQWRQGILLVKPLGQVKQPYLTCVDQHESLVECLKLSPVSKVRIDPKLGEAKVRLWADACEQAMKPIYLQIPPERSSKLNGSSLVLLRLIEWIVALIFLVTLSPIILGLVLLMRVYSPETIFSREWHVGVRGKLFRVIKFRTTEEITPLERWMRKYGLDNLPQLLNVVRGEMSLTSSRCFPLEDAIRLSPQEQQQLNKLPGMLGSSEVATSNLLHLNSQIL